MFWSWTLCFNPLFIRSVFLFTRLYRRLKMCEAKVSIPYSSGQCFFYKVMLFYFEQTPWGSFNPLFIRSVFLFCRGSFRSNFFWISFNPLFIRSVFLFRGNILPKGRRKKSFNPLFIRSVFLFCSGRRWNSWSSIPVSIPYSSGQCFFSTSSLPIYSFSFDEVSIPYSSGQCFFYKIKNIC